MCPQRVVYGMCCGRWCSSKMRSYTTRFHQPGPSNSGSLGSCIVTTEHKLHGCAPFDFFEQRCAAEACQFQTWSRVVLIGARQGGKSVLAWRLLLVGACLKHTAPNTLKVDQGPSLSGSSAFTFSKLLYAVSAWLPFILWSPLAFNLPLVLSTSPHAVTTTDHHSHIAPSFDHLPVNLLLVQVIERLNHLFHLDFYYRDGQT